MSNPATQFKKGKSGNPKGAPKKEWTMRGLIVQALEEADETKKPYKEVIARKLANLAARGDMVAIKEVNNRIDGMPKQEIDTSTTGDITIKIVEDKPNNE